MSGIYSLVSISEDPEDRCKYILAISHEPHVLENMLPAIKEIYSEDKGFSNITYEIEENTRVVEITKSVILKATPGSFIQPCEPGRAMLIPGKPGASAIESARTKLALKSKTDFSSIRLPLYCTQVVSDDIVFDALLDLGEYEFERIAAVLENPVSANPIMFDTLYEEGAINA